MGGTRFVVDYFADDEPIAISSKRTRRAIKLRAKKDPTTVFGNNRDVPIPVAWGDTIVVGGLQFLFETVHVHKTGDSFVLLDKNLPQNAAEGTRRRPSCGVVRTSSLQVLVHESDLISTVGFYFDSEFRSPTRQTAFAAVR